MHTLLWRRLRGAIGNLACLLAMVVMLGGVAQAANVTVDCGGGPADYPTIGAALAALDVTGPHTIAVSGTCSENVNIGKRDRITILAAPGATLSAANVNQRALTVNGSRLITVDGLTITGGRGVFMLGAGSDLSLSNCIVENSTSHGIQVFGGGSLTLASTTVRNNAQRGVTVNGGAVSLNGGVTIEYNGATGLVMHYGVRGQINADPGLENYFRHNGGSGIGGGNGSNITIFGANIISNNAGNGISFLHTTYLEMGEGIVEQNGRTGIYLAETSHGELFGNVIVRNNGATGTDAFTRGGIRLGENADFAISGGVQITNNTGPGFLLDSDSTLITLGGNTISNNSEGGVVLRLQSLYYNWGGPDIMLGNGGSALSCDATSLVAGDITGISPVRCMNIERPQGPPRPGHWQETN